MSGGGGKFKNNFMYNSHDITIWKEISYEKILANCILDLCIFSTHVY